MIDDPRFLRGVRLFNEGRYWDAHEAWEAIWLESAGEERDALQGVIQLAAAYVQLGRRRVPGAIRLFLRAAERLARSGHILPLHSGPLVSAAEEAAATLSGDHDWTSSSMPQITLRQL